MNLSQGNAAFLSLILPGLGHFLLGKPLRGILALLTTAGLFFLGYVILQQRLWHFVWFPPFDFLKPVFDIFPLHLWPEWVNLGCSSLVNMMRESHSDAIAQSNMLRLQRVPVDGEHLALFSTSASGIVAFLWAADAHFVAGARQRSLSASQSLASQSLTSQSPALLAFWSWLLPGSGHWLGGQQSKGLLMGAAVLTLFCMAMFYSGGHAIDRVDSPAYWIAHVLFGGGALFASLVTSPWELQAPLPGVDLGATLALVAGILNMVVMIDAFTVAERRAFGLVPAPVPGASS